MLQILDDFFSLLFPELCLACGQLLYKSEKYICLSCHYKLPKTNFHKQQDNAVSRMFWGRVKLQNVAAFLYFSKGGKVQHLIHHVKYLGKKEAGFYLGNLYGYELLHAEWIQNVELIVPVPLHKKKLRKRGYNQSEVFADGLSKALNIPVNSTCLKRALASETQTKKSRYKRWENVHAVFTIEEGHLLVNKHILLVDDVITTGATMEACANKLLEMEGVRVSVIALAFTAN